MFDDNHDNQRSSAMGRAGQPPTRFSRASKLLGLGLLIGGAFGAGCAAGAGGYGIRSAGAAASGEWAYFCFQATSADDIHVKANRAGAEGWDMVASANHEEGAVWCFRKPR